MRIALINVDIACGQMPPPDADWAPFIGWHIMVAE